MRTSRRWPTTRRGFSGFAQLSFPKEPKRLTLTPDRSVQAYYGPRTVEGTPWLLLSNFYPLQVSGAEPANHSIVKVQVNRVLNACHCLVPHESRTLGLTQAPMRSDEQQVQQGLNVVFSISIQERRTPGVALRTRLFEPPATARLPFPSGLKP